MSSTAESLTHTRAALGRYDVEKPMRDALADAACTHDDVEHWLNVERAAEAAVQAAFYEDTKDRNTRDHCALVHPNDVWLLARLDALS